MIGLQNIPELVTLCIEVGGIDAEHYKATRERAAGREGCGTGTTSAATNCGGMNARAVT